jgi:vancomycin resistance protein YoaR
VTKGEKAGGRVVVLMLVVLLLLLGGGYAAAYAAAGDNVPRGTTISGVEVGGRDTTEAVATLRSGLRDRAAAPVTLVLDGTTTEVRPDEAGLSVDHQASVEAAGGGRSWAPDRLWDYYTGGDELDAVVTVDEAAMDRTVQRVVESAGTDPRDGAVTFDDGRVRVVDPRPGEAVDPQHVRDALVAAYLQEDPTAELELVPAQPAIDSSDVREALEEFANPAVSGPVTLLFGDSRVELLPRDFAPVLRMVPVDGELEPRLDRKALAELVGDSVGADGAPVDATVRLVDGEPRVVPAKPGVRYRISDVGDTFLELVGRPEGKRVEQVGSTTARPEVTTKEARAWKIREKVSTFTTYYPYAEYRNINIGRAAELVDGTVLAPGEVFSLNETVGERTRENGFTEGFVISDGILVEDLGGGVSQMATTLFNAMFFAGLEDVEHKPHSFYIDRYPVGREATVAWGAVDLRFRNDTPYGVLIDARVTPSTPSAQGVVTVDMYSTKYWDITTSTSERYNFTQEQIRRLRTENCHPNDGYGGFDVDVVRYFRRAGESELHHKETFHTTYTPSDTVICLPPE